MISTPCGANRFPSGARRRPGCSVLVGTSGAIRTPTLRSLDAFPLPVGVRSHMVRSVRFELTPVWSLRPLPLPLGYERFVGTGGETRTRTWRILSPLLCLWGTPAYWSPAGVSNSYLQLEGLASRTARRAGVLAGVIRVERRTLVPKASDRLPSALVRTPII
jgi:hypothetical protein